MLLSDITPRKMARISGLDETLCRTILVATRRQAPKIAKVTHRGGVLVDIWFDPSQDDGTWPADVGIENYRGRVTVNLRSSGVSLIVIQRPTKTDRQGLGTSDRIVKPAELGEAIERELRGRSHEPPRRRRFGRFRG